MAKLTLDALRLAQQNILNNLSDQAIVSQHLADITETLTDLTGEVSTLTKSNSELNQYNTRLIEVNGNLLMKIPAGKPENVSTQPEVVKPISINDLIDERGNLK